MLVATTNENELFIITADTSRAELLQLKEKTSFYCPQCKYRLDLKVGKIRIPHFSHVRKTACEHYFSERESAAHLLGKQQLFSFFQRRAIDVQLESTIPTLQQRPDLLVGYGDKQYAIEFQCSRLPYEQFITRTNGYYSRHITPIWILKTPHYYSNHTVYKLSLNEFERLFIHTYHNRPYLMTYNPHTKQFVYFNHLLHIMKNMYIASIQAIHIQQQSFPFFVPNLMTEHQFQMHMKLYMQYRLTFLKKRLRYSQQGVQDLFLRGIYEMRLTREQLPLFIGVPVKNSTSIPLFSAEWQLLFFYFLHAQQLLVSQFEAHHIPYFCTWAKIVCSDDTIVAVMHYIQLLKELQVEHPHTSTQPSILFALLYRECIAIS